MEYLITIMRLISPLVKLAALLLLSAAFTVVANITEEEKEDEDEHEASAAKATTFYRTPEERREAGLGTQVTEWLKISGLIEVEREKTKFRRSDGSKFIEKEPLVKNLQLALDFEFSDSFEAEIVMELEKSKHSNSKIDEAALTWDWQELSISTGMISPSFGEYFSHFVVGPMLEFGETRAPTLSFDIGISDNWELGAFMIKSDIEHKANKTGTDWGVFSEWSNEQESLRFGVSYLSDISESDEQLLKAHHQYYQQKVDAISGYAFLGFEHIELTLEMVKTLKAFKEFEPQFNQPAAYNLEFAYYPKDNLELALRYETSKELEDNPKKRYGVGIRYLAFQHFTLAFEYLHGKYQKLPIEYDDEEEPEYPTRQENVIGAQLSVEF